MRVHQVFSLAALLASTAIPAWADLPRSAGAPIFMARRTVGGDALIRWGWPSLIGTMGLILLFYVEH